MVDMMENNKEQFEELAIRIGFDIYEENGEFYYAETKMAYELFQAAKSQATPEGFVLMPIKPTETMVMAVAKEHEGDAFLPYSLYDAFVKQAMIEA